MNMLYLIFSTSRAGSWRAVRHDTPLFECVPLQHDSARKRHMSVRQCALLLLHVPIHPKLSLLYTLHVPQCARVPGLVQRWSAVPTQVLIV